MIDRYYLDESGSTGDLAHPGERFDFGQQQIFTLACLGVDDEAALGREIERLKARHRIQAGELKSSSVRAKPEFIGELVDYVGQNGLPLMIEVVDKRFMIAATMMSTLIAPHVGAFDFTPQARMVRNAMAEYLHRHGPSSVFEAYVAACDTPSGAAVAEAFLALLTWLGKSPHQNDEVGAWLYRFASDSLKDFTADPSPEAFRRSLPLPDLGKHGQSIWMLPNLSSFTNIYARINLLYRGRVGGVTLFHDEQAHFDDILRGSKLMAEDSAEDLAVLRMPFADFRFEEQAKLVFTNSAASPGIQAADVLAGFVMRHVRNQLYASRTPSDGARKAFLRIIDQTAPEEGRGVNFVLATRDLRALDVEPVTGWSDGFSA